MVVAISVLLALPALQYAGLNMDEGLLLLYPELVLRGAVPNRDFVMSYGPGDMWLLAAVYSVAGVHVAAERLVGLGFHVLIALAVFAHASRWGPIIAVLAGIITATLLIPLGAVAFAFVGAVALVLWSLRLTSARSSPGTVALAGLLAGTAVLFRPELGPATAFAVLPLALALDRPRAKALLAGAAVPLALFAGHAVVAGPPALFDNLVLGVFRWGAARYLPLPGPDPLLLGTILVADIALVIAAGLASRAERSERSRALVGLAIFSLLTLPQALQRADLFHLVSAGTLPIALFPVAAHILLGRVGRPVAAGRRELAAVAIATLLVTAGAPGIVSRAMFIEGPRAIGVEPVESYPVRHRGRVWYPLRLAADFSRTPIGSAESAGELAETLADVERLTVPGDRIFVGLLDLRRTYVGDTVIYHLLPQLVPATYYLEMAPGSTNGPDSHLAADIATADVLVLTSRYDGWSEPNASQLPGSDAPNIVVRERFELRARHGTYSIYVRRPAGP